MCLGSRLRIQINFIGRISESGGEFGVEGVVVEVGLHGEGVELVEGAYAEVCVARGDLGADLEVAVAFVEVVRFFDVIFLGDVCGDVELADLFAFELLVVEALDA